MVSVIEKQEEIYLTKLCQYSVAINAEGDVYKYTDMIVKQENTNPKIMTFLTLMQLLNHDSHLMFNGMHSIILSHIIKFICYSVVEIINFSFTLGTGISLIRLPLYILTEIIVLLDVFYQLNWKDGVSFDLK